MVDTCFAIIATALVTVTTVALWTFLIVAFRINDDAS
jgi:hypothetical protein